MAEGKFIRVRSGAIYRWSKAMEKRRDSVIVDGHTAADYFRERGITNDITKAYPERTFDTGVPAQPQAKPAPSKGKARGTGKVVVSPDAAPDGLEELLKDGKNL